MPTVHVPGVTLTSTSGLIGAQPWAVVHHWQFGTQTTRWVQADLDLLAATIVSQWIVNFGALMATNVSVHNCVASDLTDAQSLQGSDLTTGTPGTMPGNHDPASACVLVRNQITSRYRGGHPRTYLPFLAASSMDNENTWNPTLVSNVQTSMHAWVAAVTGAAYTVPGATLRHVIPRYTYTIQDDTVHHKYVRTRSGVLGVYPVNSYMALTQVASQRKRLVT